MFPAFSGSGGRQTAETSHLKLGVALKRSQVTEKVLAGQARQPIEGLSNTNLWEQKPNNLLFRSQRLPKPWFRIPFSEKGGEETARRLEVCKANHILDKPTVCAAVVAY